MQETGFCLRSQQSVGLILNSRPFRNLKAH